MKWPHQTNHWRRCPKAAASLLLSSSLDWALVIGATIISATIIGGLIILTILLNQLPNT